MVHHDTASVLAELFLQQFLIVKACHESLDSALLNIRQLLHADFLDSELEEARELLKNRFLRAAGAVAGVALEKHLGVVCEAHAVVLKKKQPTIGDLNDGLKQVDLYDTPTWRLVSRLGDLRNLCDHNKKREPTRDEVDELIAGAEKVIKTIH